MMTRTQPSHGSSTDIRDFVAMRVNEDVRPVPVDDLQPAPVTDQQLVMRCAIIRSWLMIC
ncbi:hypothetical protein ABFU03_22455 [Xanthomonas campestris pv. campestris]|uniref:hypothetical protein n=1 Tax=Xanthomonas campestris TaxID=339 RepID=UPI00388FD0C8